MTNNTAGAVLIPQPNFAHGTLSPQGQHMVPALSGAMDGTAPGSPISSGWVAMQPGWVSNRHRHDHTWVAILVWYGYAATWWGPEYEHRILQGPGEIVVVRPGINHYAVNVSQDEWVIAYETRSSTDISLDNIPLEGVTKVPFDRGLPVGELNKLLNHPLQGHKDTDTGRWFR